MAHNGISPIRGKQPYRPADSLGTGCRPTQPPTPTHAQRQHFPTHNTSPGVSAALGTPNIEHAHTHAHALGTLEPAHITECKSRLLAFPIDLEDTGKIHICLHTQNGNHHLNLGQDTHKRSDESFCVGSVSKFISGLVIEDILAKHNIPKETPLGEIFDEKFFQTFFEEQDIPKAKKITLEMLGRHESGLEPRNPDVRIPNKQEGIIESSNDLGIKFRFLAEPGDGLQFYTNSAVNILGMVAEKLEKKPFRTIMMEQFEKNKLKGLSYNNQNSTGDLAFGLWATANGLERLMDFLVRLDPSNPNSGFNISGILAKLAAVQTEGVKRSWLFECPFEGVWGHGGNLSVSKELYHRSHFFYDENTKTGLTMVSKGIQKTEDWDQIRTVAKETLGWQDHPKLSPTFEFEVIKEEGALEKTVKENTLCVCAWGTLHRKGSQWFADGKEIETPKKLIKTPSGLHFVKYIFPLYQVTDITLSDNIPSDLVTLHEKQFQYKDTYEGINDTIHFSIKSNTLMVSITKKGENTEPQKCMLVKDGFLIFRPLTFWQYNPKDHTLTLHKNFISALLYNNRDEAVRLKGN